MGVGGFGAKIFVLRPEGVQRYDERAKTEIENDFNLMGEFVEFQPNIIFLAHLLLFLLFNCFLVIFACAQMRQPLVSFTAPVKIIFNCLQ